MTPVAAPPVAGPRIATPTRSTRSDGARAVALARAAGVQLMPWQALALDRMLALDPDDGQWQHTEVGVLVARGNGKTKLLAARILYGLVVRGEDVLGVASNNRAVARELWEDVARTFTDDGSPFGRYLAEKPRKANGQEQLAVRSLTGQVARYRIGAANGGTRGFRARLLVVDELRELTDPNAYAAMTGVQTGIPQRTQRVLTSTAGDAGSTVLNDLRDRGRLAAADPAAHPRLAWLEWSAEQGAAVTDRDAWAAANPALGVRVSAELLEHESRSVPETHFRTEYLNQWVDVLAAAVPPGVWAGATDPVPLSRDWPAWIGVELSPDRSAGALVLVARDPDGRRHVRLLDLVETAGEPVDPRQLATRAAQLRTDTRAVAVVGDAWQARPVLDQLDADRVPVHRATSSELALATAGLVAGLVAGRIRHDGDPQLGAHVLAAGTKPAGDGGAVLSRRASTGPIAAAVATALACHAAAAAPPPAPVVVAARRRS